MIDKISLLLDGLGNENRRNIIELLKYKPCYNREIQRLLNLNPRLVNHHIKRLKDMGFLSSFHSIHGRELREYYYVKQDLSIQIIQPKWVVKDTQKTPLSLRDTISLFEHLLQSYNTISEELDIMVEKQFDLKNRLSDLYLSDSVNNSQNSHCPERGTTVIEIAVLLDFLYGSRISNLEATSRTVCDLAISTNHAEAEIMTALVSLTQRKYINLTPENRYCLCPQTKISAIQRTMNEIITLNQQKQTKKDILSTLHTDLKQIQERFLKLLRSGELTSDDRRDIIHIVSESSIVSDYERTVVHPDDFDISTVLNSNGDLGIENTGSDSISKLLKKK